MPIAGCQDHESTQHQSPDLTISVESERQAAKAKEAGPTPAHKARPETHATMLAYSIDDLKINIDQIGSTLVVVVVSLFYFNIWTFRAEGFVLQAAGQCSNLRTPNRSDRPLKLVLKQQKCNIEETRSALNCYLKASTFRCWLGPGVALCYYRPLVVIVADDPSR